MVLFCLVDISAPQKKIFRAPPPPQIPNSPQTPSRPAPRPLPLLENPPPPGIFNKKSNPPSRWGFVCRQPPPANPFSKPLREGGFQKVPSTPPLGEYAPLGVRREAKLLRSSYLAPKCGAAMEKDLRLSVRIPVSP